MHPRKRRAPRPCTRRGTTTSPTSSSTERLLAAALAALVAGAAPAQDEGLEISGLVIDETLTRGGRDFFAHIARRLGPLEDRPFTVEVRERAAPGRSTFVVVLVDDRPVFRASLDPLPGRIEETANRAIARLAAYVAARRLELRELETY